jgi:hypothetical protein
MLGLVTAMFGTAGTLLNISKRAQNQDKASQTLCPYLILFVYSLLPSSLPDIMSIRLKKC